VVRINGEKRIGKDFKEVDEAVFEVLSRHIRSD
jgi:uncharacterized protein (DUF2267 family)